MVSMDKAAFQQDTSCIVVFDMHERVIGLRAPFNPDITEPNVPLIISCKLLTIVLLFSR